ncbi:hypothetical protein V5799_008903 [Amblyomma americanum]|uniref:Secreted protein n=1 Tax=Amblyomma americanum TaxID=6943 RepID=A0AAQ4FDE6_AMBAM
MDALRPAKYAAFLLKCAPLVVLVLFGAAQTVPNNYPVVPSGPYWTLLDITQMGWCRDSCGTLKGVAAQWRSGA